MATNPHFNHITNTGEQEFFEQLVIESIQVMGQDFKYLPRTMDGVDDILLEPINSKFETIHTIEMQLADTNSFGGNGDIMSKFGLYVTDSCELFVSRKRFRELGITDRSRPYEGDIIYDPVSKNFFEINFVEEKGFFYPLGTWFVYKLTCEVYTGNDEKFTTGDTEVDDVMRDVFSNATEYAVNSSNEAVKEKSNTIVDFSEDNPFGGL